MNRPMLPLRRRAPLLGAVVLFLFAAVACTSDKDVSIQVEFADDAIRAESSLVITTIHEGTCDGRVLFDQAFRRGDPPTMDVTTLAPGTYGFAAVARNTDCEPIGAVCRVLQVPMDEATIVLTLAPMAPGTAECAPSACDDGACSDDPSLDGGVDAGADAATDGAADADLDGGTDAGDAATDTAVPDSGPTITAPTVVSPWSGVATGAAGAVVGAGGPSDHPLLPEVRWLEVAGAMSYVMEMIRCDVADISTCDLGAATTRVVVPGPPLRARPAAPLDISTTAPVGARYAFRVGACAAPAGVGCTYAPARYLDVGRIAQDTDGDGDGDLYAVTETSAGVTGVKEITGFGAGATTDIDLGITGIRGIYWIGDYDADGVGELAVSTDGAAGGRVIFVDNLAQAGAIDETTPGADLGERVAGLGDVDGDGYADFAITVPGDEVRVQFGGPTWNAADGVVIRPSSGLSYFATDIAAVGDRNMDGLPDLAIVSRLAMDQARIEVYSVAGSAPRLIEMQDVGTGEIRGSGQPPPIVISGGVDLDDDGRPEIGVGQPEVDEMIIIFADGRREGAAPPRVARYGAAIAAGDIDGTGRGRFIVGDPLVRSDIGGDEAGQLTVIAYTGAPFMLIVVPYFTPDPVHLGHEICTVDLNGDGLDDFFTVSEDGFIIDRLSFDPIMGGIRGTRFLFSTGGRAWKTITR